MKGLTGGATLAQALGERIAATRFEDLSPEVLRYARQGLIDTVGVTIAGSREPATAIAAQLFASERGDCLLLGSSITASALSAALLNGIAANVIDFDDCNDNLGGHPSAPVLSAFLPLAQQCAASGRQVVLAYVAGVEAETQVAKAVNFHHYEKGWHPTSTLGVFGAAAACSKLLDLTAAQTATALAISASLASGIKANFGTMTKALHIGHAARDGAMAALLARGGFSADATAFEHHHGFFEVFNGAGTYDAARALAQWGDPFDIAWPGLVVKQYPCCLSAQASVDATLKLLARHDVRPDDVAQVEARLAPRRLAHTDIPSPRDDLDAKLSLQYCVARAVADRRILPQHFRDEAFRAPAIAALMERVRVAAADHLQVGEALGAEITLRTRSGQVFEEAIDRPVGHDPGVPLPEELLHRKFMACIDGVIDGRSAEELYALLGSAAGLADIRTLVDAIRRRTVPAS